MRRWLCLLMSAMLLRGCGKRMHVVPEGDEPFRAGDLVFRLGYGAESRAVATAGGSVYSHVGILVEDTVLGKWYVVHAVPGEAADGEEEFVKCEPLSAFYAPDRARAGAWMRVDCSDSIANLAARYALGKVKKNVVFDNDYLLSDTTQLYCTELVWLSYMRFGVDVSSGKRHQVPQIFSRDGEGIFPSDIEQSETKLFIKQFN